MARIAHVGASGLDHFNGFMHVDFLKEMRGTLKYKNINRMRLNSAVIGAALMAIKFPILNIDWFYTSDKGEDDPRLKLLNKSKNGMSFSWNEHVFEALTFIDFGFAPVAIQYKREEGEVLWDRFMLMGQDTIQNWDIDKQGNIKGLFQYPHINIPRVPMERVLLFRVNVERNSPEGRSMLRTAYPSYYYASELAKIEAIGKERGMAGIPVIKLPQEADRDEDNASSDVNKANVAVRNIRTDEQAGMVLPYGWELELMTTGLNSELAMNLVIQRYETRMLMATLSQFVMLGMPGMGGSSNKSDMDLFNIAIDSLADIISETHNKHAIPRLMELNGMETDGLRLEHAPPGDVNFVELAQSLAMLGDRITWTPEDEVQTRSTLRLPRFELSQVSAMREEAKAELEEQANNLEEKRGEETMKREGRDKVGIKPQKPTLKSGSKNKRKDDTTSNPHNRMTSFEGPSAKDPPDETERLKHERRWIGRMSNYFTGALERVSGAVDK